MRPSLPLSFALVAAACTSEPLAPIPPPLPETLAWASEPVDGGGAFLGLKTRENVGGGFEELEFSAGVRVTRVVENSPAAEAGFQVGDVVLALDGAPIDDPVALDALVEGSLPDSEVRLDVQRGDTVFAVPVKLRAAGVAAEVRAEVVQRLDPARSRAGWVTGRGGAVLVASDDEAPFPRAGVPVGSVVTHVDGEEVHSDRALIRGLQEREPGTTVEVAFLDPSGEANTARVTLRDQKTRVTGFSLPILLGYEADAEGEETSFTLIDLWFLWLFRYERDGQERRWSILRFIRFETGVGELSE